jgi:serine/threonine protein kinase
LSHNNFEEGWFATIDQGRITRVEAVQVLGGRYRLVERLGHGGMSVVWQAYDEVLGRQVAVKVLAAKLAADKDSRDRIRAEAQAAARLSHPHITGVFDYGESTGDDGVTVPYVVMELIAGRTLAQRLARGPMPWRAALRVSAEVAAALSAAHARGLVHRDVKPANVMLTASGAKVVDFGIAAIAGETGDNDPEGMVLGTPAYLAPERLAGGPVRPATDVYALGLLLYRSLTGALPWKAETTTQMIKAHVYHEPKPLPAVDGLPDGVADLCLRCLAKDPERRPTSREVARTLAGAAGIRVQLNAADGDSDDLALESRPLPAGAVARPPGRLRQAVAALFGPGVDPNADTSMLPNSVIDSAAIVNARKGRNRRLAQVGTAAAGLVAAGVLVNAFANLAGDKANSPAEASSNAISKAPCSVRYKTVKDSAGQFSVNVTVTNNRNEAVTGWMLQFAFSGDQTLQEGLIGQWAQTANGVVSVRDTTVGAVLEPRRAATVGFTAAYRSDNPLPTSFALNGTPCAYVLTGASGETKSSGPVPPPLVKSAPPVGGELPGTPVSPGLPVNPVAKTGGNQSTGGSTTAESSTAADSGGTTTTGEGSGPGSGNGGSGTAGTPTPEPTGQPTKPPKTPKPMRSHRSKPPPATDPAQCTTDTCM